jgi:hypothetical protein
VKNKSLKIYFKKYIAQISKKSPNLVTLLMNYPWRVSPQGIKVIEYKSKPASNYAEWMGSLLRNKFNFGNGAKKMNELDLRRLNPPSSQKHSFCVI